MLAAFSTTVKSNSTLSKKVNSLRDKFIGMRRARDKLFDKLIQCDTEKRVIEE